MTDSIAAPVAVSPDPAVTADTIAVSADTVGPAVSVPRVRAAIPDTVVTDLTPLEGDLRMPQDITGIPSDTLSTVLVDIIAADTTIVVPPQWSRGLEPAPRSPYAGGDSLLLLVLSVVFVSVGVNATQFPRVWRNFRYMLTTSRRRGNLFDDLPGVPWYIRLVLLVQYVVFGGTALYAASGASGAVALGAMVALVGAFFAGRAAAYAVTGYAFGDGGQRRRWMEAFGATRSLAGAALVIPVMLMLFFPECLRGLTICCGTIGLSAQILYIYRGFRIFYQKIGSILYFFLYLCALEIIPDLLLLAAWGHILVATA